MILTILLQVSDWGIFIGRFHPVLVHLPIGFLLIAALLEIGNRTKKISVSDSAVSFVLFWAAIGATMACVAGYLLSLGGGYEEGLLATHQWQGIGVAVLAWIAWAVKSFEKIPFGPKVYLPALGIGTLLTFTAGHDGGSLTHGEGYLTQYTPQPFRGWAGMPPREETADVAESAIKPIADINQAVVYADLVQPILTSRCSQCHNGSKKKGGLRVDGYEHLLKGGEGGAAFVAGKSTESDLVRRCLLPLEDDDHMPPKGKTQLTNEQIALLSWWIDQGATQDKKVSDLQVTEAVKPVLALLGAGATPDAQPASVEPKQSPALSLKVSEPSANAVESIKKANLLITPLAKDLNIVEVSAVNTPAFDDGGIGLLTPLSEQIVWLKLGSTKITDASMKEIGKLKNLHKLHLEHTSVGDNGLQNLKDLKYLEYINLVGTKVTDTGLKSLAELPSLKSVYIWQSAVTNAGVAAVAKSRPDLEVVNGMNESQVAAFLKAGKKDSVATATK
jgi:mono/diheme cytochrome c family protein